MTQPPIRPTAIALSLLVLAACSDTTTEPETAAAPSSPELAVAANSWITRADYPHDVWLATSASITNPSTLRTIVYVIGGNPRSWGAGAISSAVKAYDVSANVWSSRASYPVRVESTNEAVVIGGKIYVSGGFTRRWDEANGVYRLQTLPSLYVYNPATDHWTRRSDMPMATVNGVSGTYGGMLYVATSCYEQTLCGDSFDQGALWRYNPSTDRWVMLGRTPHDPWAGAGGFIGGKFYLVQDLGAVDIYDPATNSWTAGPPLPVRQCMSANTTFQAKLYLVGCHDDDDTSGSYPMLVFDPKLGSWSQAAAPPVDANFRWTLTRVFVNGQPRLELVGGERPGNNLQYIP